MDVDYEEIYEKPYHVEWLGKYKGYEKQVEIASKLAKGHRILDIGCGEGVITSRINAIGIDISINALKYGKKFFKIELVRANAICLPFKDDSFDCVTAFELIEHLSKEDMHKCLTEMRRVCKKGGRIVISTPNLSSFYFCLFGALGIRNREHINEMDFIIINTLSHYFRIVEVHSNTETPWLRSAFLTRLISFIQGAILRAFPKLVHLLHNQIYIVAENTK